MNTGARSAKGKKKKIERAPPPTFSEDVCVYNICGKELHKVKLFIICSVTSGNVSEEFLAWALNDACDLWAVSEVH